jgi:hypothetical protein
LVEDIPTKNNTDKSADKTVKTNYEGRAYYFSSAQDPSQHTSVYDSSDIFALAMFQHSAPTLLAYRGAYMLLPIWSQTLFRNEDCPYGKFLW